MFKSFKQHVNETDSGRINQMISKSLQDAQWILKKVGLFKFMKILISFRFITVFGKVKRS